MLVCRSPPVVAAQACSSGSSGAGNGSNCTCPTTNSNGATTKGGTITYNNATGQYEGYCGCLPGFSHCVNFCEQGIDDSDCQDCLSGTTTPNNCYECQEGTYQPVVAFTNTTCLPCEAGTFNSDEGQASCTNCPAGQFQALTGQEECENCPAGTFNPDTSSPTPLCTNCGVGQFEDGTSGTEGFLACESCHNGSQTIFANGTFTPSGATLCSACPVGTASDDTNGSIACPPCAAGHYQSSTGQSSCHACGLGQYQNVTGQTECQDCWLGGQTSLNVSSSWVYTDSAATQCVACPMGQHGSPLAASNLSTLPCIDCEIGRYQNSYGAASCVGCPVGRFTAFNGSDGIGDCQACTAGQFQNTTGQSGCLSCSLGSQTMTSAGFSASAATQCIPCAAGTFGSPQNSTGPCQVCAVGTYQDAAAQTGCIECPAGTYVATVGSDELADCIDCAVGQYHNNTGQTTCENCTVGSQTVVLNSTSGLAVYTNLAATGCVQCAAGQYGSSSIPTAACQPCAAGTYQDAAGLTFCDACGAGQFQNQLGAAACNVCSAGHQTTRANGSFTASSATLCSACSVGTVSNDTNGSSTCQACAIGYYQSGTGQTSCIACALGFYTNFTGQSACLACTNGSNTVGPNASGFLQYTESAATHCVACPTGQYSDPINNTGSCDPCPIGTYQDSAGSQSCTPCPAGTFVAAVGSDQLSDCVACPAGRYVATTGNDDQGDCISCPGGQYVESTASDHISDCQDCPAGRFAANEGNDEFADCIACEPGTFQPVAGTTECNNCTFGNQTEDGNGNYTNTSALACVQCAAGRYAIDPSLLVNGNGSAFPDECATCPAGSMTADVTDPALAVFMHVGATACAQCWAVSSAGSLASQASQCANGSCGYADLDADSSTVCDSCMFGTFAADDGALQCTDFDECASGPCENGGSCWDNDLTHPLYLGNPMFNCECLDNGFTGERCEYVDECQFDPCHLTYTTPPAELDLWPSVLRTPRPTQVFRCPTAIQCTDPDMTVADNYICTCPLCADVMLTNTTAVLLGDFLQGHPGFASHLYGQMQVQSDAQSVCANPAATGCTDPSAYNFDTMASVDDGSCIPKVYGCNDPIAVNFDPMANSYDSSGVLGERCRTVRCGSPTGPVPSCPPSNGVAWDGPVGGLCVRYIGATEESTPWVCLSSDGAPIAMVTYGSCPDCIQVDECANNSVRSGLDCFLPCCAPALPTRVRLPRLPQCSVSCRPTRTSATGLSTVCALKRPAPGATQAQTAHHRGNLSYARRARTPAVVRDGS